jgi:hypothetical protein
MGALYLASKLEECPVRMRDLINVFDLLLARAKHALQADRQVSSPIPLPSYHSIDKILSHSGILQWATLMPRSTTQRTRL